MDGARYLEDGRLTVFRRNGTYYARLRLSPGKYVTRSLKTTTEEVAVQAGRRLLFQLEHRAEQGLPPTSKLFSTVIVFFLRHSNRLALVSTQSLTFWMQPS
jgi:integrase